MHDLPYSPTELLDNPPPCEPAWITPAMLTRGGQMLLGAETKAGKSFVALELARALVTGTSPFGSGYGVPEACNVLFLDRELGQHTLLERWARYDPGRVAGRLTAWNPHKLYLDDPAQVKKLDGVIKDRGIGALVVDPINRFCYGSVTDNDTVRRFLDGIDELLVANTATGLAVIMVLHANKPTVPAAGVRVDPLDHYRLAGAATWMNVADTVVTLARRTPGNEHDSDGDYWDVDMRVTCRHGAAQPDNGLRIRPTGTPPVTALKPSLRFQVR